jgi:hypothetical protein
MRGVSGEAAAAPDPERRQMSGREEGAEADLRGWPTTRSVEVEEGAGRTGPLETKLLIYVVFRATLHECLSVS